VIHRRGGWIDRMMPLHGGRAVENRMVVLLVMLAEQRPNQPEAHNQKQKAN
jgi:hypothetical protein